MRIPSGEEGPARPAEAAHATRARCARAQRVSHLAHDRPCERRTSFEGETTNVAQPGWGDLPRCARKDLPRISLQSLPFVVRPCHCVETPNQLPHSDRSCCARPHESPDICNREARLISAFIC